MSNEMPAEPLSELQEAAAGLHELYISLRDSGFTRYDALILLGVYVAHIGKANE